MSDFNDFEHGLEQLKPYASSVDGDANDSLAMRDKTALEQEVAQGYGAGEKGLSSPFKPTEPTDSLDMGPKV